MTLTRNQSVMKAIAEDCLRWRGVKGSVAPTNEDVMIALQIVKLLIKHPEVHVVSDGRRIFEAFAEAWHLPAHEVASVEHLIYLNDATVIFLHTGARSDAQHERYQKFLKVAKGNPFLDFYHVGRWFV